MRRERGFEVREMTVLTVFALRRLSGFISPPFQAIPVHRGGRGNWATEKYIHIFPLDTYKLILSVHSVIWKRAQKLHGIAASGCQLLSRFFGLTMIKPKRILPISSIRLLFSVFPVSFIWNLPYLYRLLLVRALLIILTNFYTF